MDRLPSTLPKCRDAGRPWQVVYYSYLAYTLFLGLCVIVVTHRLGAKAEVPVASGEAADMVAPEGAHVRRLKPDAFPFNAPYADPTNPAGVVYGVAVAFSFAQHTLRRRRLG